MLAFTLAACAAPSANVPVASAPSSVARTTTEPTHATPSEPEPPTPIAWAPVADAPVELARVDATPRDLPDVTPDPLREAVALGYLDPRAGAPHLVRLEEKPEPVVAFLLPPNDGARLAVANGTPWVVTHVGPAVDLEAECARYLAFYEGGGALLDDADHEVVRRCPYRDAVITLADTAPALARALAALVPARLPALYGRGAERDAWRWYARGNDPLAAHHAEAARRFFDDDRAHRQSLGALLREVARRRALAPHDVAIPSGGAVDPSLVRALIDGLDEVRATGRDHVFRDAPRVDALVRVGPPALDALLDTVRRDDRLTRALHGDPWHRAFHAASVREAAWRAIERILDMPPRSDRVVSQLDDPRVRALLIADARRAMGQRPHTNKGRRRPPRPVPGPTPSRGDARGLPVASAPRSLAHRVG